MCFAIFHRRYYLVPVGVQARRCLNVSTFRTFRHFKHPCRLCRRRARRKLDNIKRISKPNFITRNYNIWFARERRRKACAALSEDTINLLRRIGTPRKRNANFYKKIYTTRPAKTKLIYKTPTKCVVAAFINPATGERKSKICRRYKM